MNQTNTMTPKVDIDDMILRAETELSQFGPSIAEMREKYLSLTIDGVGDKKGLALVAASRKEVKKFRCSISNRGKELRAGATKYSKAVLAVEKSLLEEIQPVEQYLINQEAAVQDELDRLKAEEEAAKEKKIEARIDRLNDNKLRVEPQMIRLMDDDDFEEYFSELQLVARKEEEQREAERLKLEAEQKQLEEERKALAAEKERLAEQARIEQQERDAELETERQKLREQAEAEAKVQEEERAKEQAELERLRKQNEERQAAENERLRKEQEAKAAADRKAAEEARLKREEELKPVREKLDAMAGGLEQMKVPAGLAEFDAQLSQILCAAAEQIRALAR